MRAFDDPVLRISAIALPAALYSFCVSGGVINGSELTDYVAGFGPSYFAALWVAQDGRRTGYQPALHYALYVWLFWYVLLPHYVLRTRGRSGLSLAVLLTGVLWVPVLASFAGWWLYEELPDFR